MQLPIDFVPFSGGLFPPGEGIFLLYQRKRWTISRGGVRSGSLASANRQHSQRVPLDASGNVTLHPMSRGSRLPTRSGQNGRHWRPSPGKATPSPVLTASIASAAAQALHL